MLLWGGVWCHQPSSYVRVCVVSCVGAATLQSIHWQLIVGLLYLRCISAVSAVSAVSVLYLLHLLLYLLYLLYVAATHLLLLYLLY